MEEKNQIKREYYEKKILVLEKSNEMHEKLIQTIENFSSKILNFLEKTHKQN